jgi:L-rhamnose mutarotase
MQRVCFLLKVKEEKTEEYKRMHAHVWPEMKRALHTSGWHNYTLFMKPDGLVVGYFETEDFEQARERILKEPAYQRWREAMRPYRDTASEASMGNLWNPLEEIFHLD